MSGRDRRRAGRRAALLLAGALALAPAAGCSSIQNRQPVPQASAALARVPGIPNARMWADGAPPALEFLYTSSRDELRARYPAVFGRPHHYLAVSGGGEDGAFGAGLLAGWTASGTRPEFAMVTGVSTGAIIAPFAFLGPEWDGPLEEAYTTHATKDFFRRAGVRLAFRWDAAASSRPMKEIIARYMTREMLDAIGAEHRLGRRLLIGTTNLDAARPVLWDLGAIAVSDAPGRLELARKVILASASIPGAVPPVFFEVEADGRRYDEMHVDGGTTSQVFLFPAGLDGRDVARVLEAKGQPRVYVIRNAQLDPKWEAVKPRAGAIARRSLRSLIRAQGIGDLYRIYLKAQRDGLDYNLAFIPSDLELEEKSELIDKAYMQELFRAGYELAADGGYPWLKAPPGLESLHPPGE